MRAALDAAIPSDLRRLLRTAGAGWDLVLGTALIFLSALGLVASPWLIGKAVNDLQRGSTESLLEVSLAVAGAGILTALTTGGAMWFLGRYAVTVGMRIRELLHDRLLSASLDLFQAHPTGQLVARVTADVEPIKLFLTSAVSVVTQLAGTVIFATVTMFLIDPELAVIALTPFPFAIFVQLRYSNRTRAATAAAEQSRGVVAAQAADNIRGAKLVMSLGREEEQKNRFDRAVETLFDRWLRVGRLDGTYGVLLAVFPYIGLGLILAFGGRAVIDGRISLGEFVTFNGFGGMLAAAASQISYLTYLTASAAGSAVRIVELLDYPHESAGADGPPELRAKAVDLGLRDVRVSHGAEAPLRGVTLDLPSGETVALVGATGAGMRTVLELAGGLVSPEGGEIRVDGRALERADLPLLRKISAPAGQGRLFSMSIAENIAYGRPDASPAEIEAAARRAHAHEVILRLSSGYDTQVGEGGGQLSGGERQRIALARALLVTRPILLLDDVTSALDPEAANEVLDGLASGRVGATRLISTNGAPAVTLADRIAVLDGGRVIGLGTHRELLESCPPYRAMVELWELA
jgi:ABC-type multidrug transport system fused ATPase/permease subunit